uniref:RAP domain-containing protein n=1 Tax=Cacopsylla melanoneura TaxID=428564 RepID=A0A8D8YE83_9HEMI
MIMRFSAVRYHRLLSHGMSRGTHCSQTKCYNLLPMVNPVCLRLLASSSRDVPTTPTFSSNREELSKDILLEKIKSSSDTGEIFESLKLHLSIMNPSHQFITLNMLFQLEKSGNSRMSKSSIVKSPEFQNLCKALVPKIHTFSTEDMISMLKCLTYFKVHAKSKIIQSTLQILASNVNDLSLQNIMFLDFLLADLQTSPLVEALKMSLPIVFQAQYSSRVNKESNASLIDMLAFATRKQLSEDVTNQLLDTLVERNDIDYNERQAKSIVMSIVHCKKHKSVHGILLNRTLLWISQQLAMNRFKLDDVETLTARLVNKYVWVDDIFYNETFLNSVTDYLIDNEHDFNECMLVLKKLARIHFVSKPLLEHMATKAYSNPSQLETIQAGASISYLSSLSDANYKPPHWEMIQAYFLHNFENTFWANDKLELPWMKIALEFASLDVFPSFLYEKIFQSHFLEKYVRENNVLDYYQLLQVYQVYQSHHPSPKSVVLPQHMIDKAVDYYMSKECSLQSALEKGLGGGQHVQSKVFSKNYHFIDYVIAMRKGGFPIPLQSSSESSAVFLDDIRANLPEGHYMIAIIALPDSAFTLNTGKLRGAHLLYLRSLEKCTGVNVLPIHVDKWTELPDHEKIPYLMQFLLMIVHWAYSQTL